MTRGLLLLALLLTVLAAFFTGRLQLTADLADLLPADSEAAQGYRQVLERFGGREKVFVMVSASDATVTDGDLVGAVEVLESSLSSSPEVSSVRSGWTEEDQALIRRHVAPRAALLLPGDPADAAETVRRRTEPAALRDRARQLRASLATPGGALEAAFAREDPLGLLPELDLRPGLGLPVDPLTSLFLARGPGPDDRAALLVVTPARAEMDPEGGRALQAALDQAAGDLDPETDLTIEALGGPLYAARDESAIRRDIERTVTTSALAVTLLLVLAFRGLRLPLVALASVAVGLLWTGGVLGVVSPGLSAVAMGFAAVLVGLGVDYGIHAVARFRQSRTAGLAPPEALRDTARRAGPAIVTSAMTTAGAFAALAFAHFRPLAEVGRIVPLGLLLILAAGVLVGGPLLLVTARSASAPPGRVWDTLDRLTEEAVGLAARRPRAVLAAVLVLTLTAGWGWTRLRLDPSLEALRPADLPTSDLEARLAERFGLGADTVNLVVHASDVPTAVERAAELGRGLEAELPDATATNPADWLAASWRGGETAERRRLLAELPLESAADTLEAELRTAGLAPAAFRSGLDALRALGRGEDPGPPLDPTTVADWPGPLREAVAVDDDGAWVLVAVRLPTADNRAAAAERLATLQTLANPGEGKTAATFPASPETADGPAVDSRGKRLPSSPGGKTAAVFPGSARVSVASADLLGRDLRSLAVADARAAAGIAAVVVLLVVIASFRGRWRFALTAALPVTLGALWTLGLWSAAGRPLDLLSIAVLPILLGVGIDDGLHLAHRAIEVGTTAAARETGPALTLTTLTTVAGFGSLTLSRIPGLARGGALTALGVLACLAATLLVPPALEALAARRRGSAP